MSRLVNIVGDVPSNTVRRCFMGEETKKNYFRPVVEDWRGLLTLLRFKGGERRGIFFWGRLGWAEGGGRKEKRGVLFEGKDGI